MKKINFITALTITAGLAFVWNVTAEGENTGTSYWPEGYNAAWYVDNPGTTSSKQTLFRAVTDDAVLSFSIERNNSNGFTFGTYTTTTEIVDGVEKTIILKETLGTVDSTTVDENGKIKIKPEGGQDLVDSVPSGTYNSKDLVGVWVQETGSDLIYYSDNNLTIAEGAKSQTVANYVSYGTTGADSNYFSTPEEADTVNDPNLKNPTTFVRMQFTEGLIEGGDFPVGTASLWFDDANTYTPAPGQKEYNNDKYNYGYPGQPNAAILIHVQGVSPASDGGQTNGHPLPGVWATIALAGAASAYLRRRKNK